MTGAPEFMVSCCKCKGRGLVKKAEFGGSVVIERRCRLCRGTGQTHDKDAHIKHLQAQLAAAQRVVGIQSGKS